MNLPAGPLHATGRRCIFDHVGFAASRIAQGLRQDLGSERHLPRTRTRCGKGAMRKYPRTWHLPFSPGLTRDDRIMPDGVSGLLGVPLVCTEKMDGSNILLSRQEVLPRARWHESMGPIKEIHAQIRWELPEEFLLCGEWLAAVHSIFYDRLSAFYQVFGIFDRKRQVFLSWDAVEEWCALLELETVPLLARNVSVSSEAELEDLVARLMALPPTQGAAREGLVVRVAAEIPEHAFGRLVGKYVREGHVAEDATPWYQGTWERNRLAMEEG